MRKDARRDATEEGKSYMDAASYQDVSNLSQNLVMSKATYRIWGTKWLPDWTDKQKDANFDKLRADQGSDEDTTDENISIKKPSQVQRHQDGETC